MVSLHLLAPGAVLIAERIMPAVPLLFTFGFFLSVLTRIVPCVGYSLLELKPCERRSLGMDEFVVLVAETSVTSYFVLSNLLTVF